VEDKVKEKQTLSKGKEKSNKVPLELVGTVIHS